MVIKRSAGEETAALIADLEGDDETRREAAMARLAVIGTRAVGRLLSLLRVPSVTVRARVSALRTLESIGDARALSPALALLDSPEPEVGSAAVAVLQTFLHSNDAGAVLDRLVACSLDPTRPERVRLAALDALIAMGSRVVTPVWEQLRDDPSPAVRQRVARETGAVDPIGDIEAAAAGVLPEDPDAMRTLVEKTGATAALPTLYRLVGALTAREAMERSPSTRNSWRVARGAVHAALAARGSRVALYDLRESIGQAVAPLPDSFLSAIAVIGDAGSLEPIAAAYARGVKAGSREWLEQLKGAFRAIATRERLTSRHSVMKRIATRWPAATDLIEKKVRTTRR